VKLRRIITTNEYFPEIDGLRFVAIFAVLIVHISNELLFRTNNEVTVQDVYLPLIAVLHQCTRGVEVFFVISGFVLGRPFAKQYLMRGQKISLDKYFLRRLTRLEPPYVLAMTLCAITFSIFNHIQFWDMLPHYLTTLLYVHGAVYGYAPFFSTVVWSLAVEIQFYLLVPLLTLLFKIDERGTRRGLLAAVILASGLLQHIFLGESSPQQTSAAQASLLYYLQYFLAGFLLVDLHLLEMSRWKRSWKWDVVSIVLWPVIFWLPFWWAHLALPLLIIAVSLAAFQGRLSGWFFRHPFIVTIGGMCYSIYLLHVYVIAAVFRETRHLMVFRDFMENFLTQFILMFIPIVAVSAIYFVLVERPCMDPRWPQKLAAHLRRGQSSGRTTDLA
jgi:peptidoglycan/LPS O-acetylase OafA/YrhL